MKNILRSFLDSNLQVLRESFTPKQQQVLLEMARRCAQALKGGRKILLCGNGGSAADCQHVAAELVGRFKKERKSLAAIALTTDTSILTALANDYSFDRVFSRQVEGLGERGDVLIAISTSGNSQNVLEAIKQAKAMDVLTLALTGKPGGKLKSAVDLAFCAASSETPYIQSVHSVALHALCFLIEEASAGSS